VRGGLGLVGGGPNCICAGGGVSMLHRWGSEPIGVIS
jgi:hypothetical protein